MSTTGVVSGRAITAVPPTAVSLGPTVESTLFTRWMVA